LGFSAELSIHPMSVIFSWLPTLATRYDSID
jgi:hypothetical protein